MSLSMCSSSNISFTASCTSSTTYFAGCSTWFSRPWKSPVRTRMECQPSSDLLFAPYMSDSGVSPIM